jgi:hypothetical protein
MAKDEDQFELKLGRVRSRTGGLRRARSLQSQLIGKFGRAGGDWKTAGLGSSSSRPSGRFNARGRGTKLSQRFTHACGRGG